MGVEERESDCVAVAHWDELGELEEVREALALGETPRATRSPSKRHSDKSIMLREAAA